MKNFILTLAVLVCGTAFAQTEPFFENSAYKQLFFSSDSSSVDFIVVADSSTADVFGVVRNYEYENPLTFFTPGSYAAVGVSLGEDSTITVVAGPLFFSVKEETEDLSSVKL